MDVAGSHDSHMLCRLVYFREEMWCTGDPGPALCVWVTLLVDGIGRLQWAASGRRVLVWGRKEAMNREEEPDLAQTSEAVVLQSIHPRSCV